MRTDRTRAFTIIELMVSIGVIGVLLGLLLPVLAGARERARETQSLANLHSLGLTITAYTQLHKGAFPFPPQAAEGPTQWGPYVWEPSGGRGKNSIYIYSASVFDASVWWPALLHDVAPWKEHFASWLSPGMDLGLRDDQPPWARAPTMMGYSYSNSFLAKPRVWSSIPASEADIGPISVDLVAQPSAKVIFYDAVRAYLRTITLQSPRPVLFVDGAASLRRDQDATRPVENQLRGRSPQLYHDTAMGVHGRDF